MSRRALVLDANILVRAVLGRRVLGLVREYAGSVAFFAPDVAYADARQHLPPLLKKHGIDLNVLLPLLTQLETVVRPIPEEIYLRYRKEALRRIAVRDADDWPVVACAMALSCPLWTEDTDFFGSGVPIWTTDRVELYLASSAPAA